jgi:hypothetical protein
MNPYQYNDSPAIKKPPLYPSAEPIWYNGGMHKEVSIIAENLAFL